MKPLFSIADYSFPLLELDIALDLIAAMKFSYVDLGITQQPDGIHFPMEREFLEPEKAGGEAMRKIKNRGLAIADIFLFTNEVLNHPDQNIRSDCFDIFKRGLAYASAAGAKHMTVLPGRVFDGSRRDSLSRSVQELTKMVNEARGYDIVLSVEPHIGSIIDTPQKARELLSMADGLTLTLDYSHFIHDGIAQNEINALIPSASHMHFRNAAKGVLQTIFPETEIDYDDLVSSLLQYGYNGIMALEFGYSDWGNQKRTDNISETIILRRHLEHLINTKSQA